MNYTQIVTMIQDEVENEETSFVSHIPNFVKAAERRIYNLFDLPVARKNSVGALTVNNQYLTMPNDWIDIHSLAVILPSTQEQRFLLDKDVEFIREAFPIPTYTGVPGYFAVFDNDTLLLGPTPDVAYEVELHYFAYPMTIVTAETTWLGDYYPEALLWAAVKEAYVYMKGEKDILDMYEARFQENVIGLPKLMTPRRDTYRRRAA